MRSTDVSRYLHQLHGDMHIPMVSTRDEATGPGTLTWLLPVFVRKAEAALQGEDGRVKRELFFPSRFAAPPSCIHRPLAPKSTVLIAVRWPFALTVSAGVSLCEGAGSFRSYTWLKK